MHIYIYITYIYICKCNHKSSVLYHLSPQWLCCNSWIWAHDVWLKHSA